MRADSCRREPLLATSSAASALYSSGPSLSAIVETMPQPISIPPDPQQASIQAPVSRIRALFRLELAMHLKIASRCIAGPRSVRASTRLPNLQLLRILLLLPRANPALFPRQHTYLSQDSSKTSETCQPDASHSNNLTSTSRHNSAGSSCSDGGDNRSSRGCLCRQ